MYEIIFLSCLAIVWLLFASIQDLKTRMVANWLSFSLIIFALGFRFFYSLFEGDFQFFYQGVFGMVIFFVVGNVLYYGRMFAGGDAKLIIALGAVLPFSEIFYVNLKIFFTFVIVLLYSGAFYGLIWSLFLPLGNFGKMKNELKKQFHEKKLIMISGLIFSAAVFLLGFYNFLFFYLGILLLLLPYLYIYAKTVDEIFLVKEESTKKLEEGDWLYRDLKIGKETIKSEWQGLNKSQIKKIQKHLKKIKIRQGIPFVPVFLISFVIFLWIYSGDFKLVNNLIEFFGN